MSPERPVPQSVQLAIARQLAMAMGGPYDTFDSRERAEFQRQASVALDTLRCMEPGERDELLADLRQEPDWLELAPIARADVHAAVSMAYVANSATLPSMTNQQLETLAGAARLVLDGKVPAGRRPLLVTSTSVGTYRDDGESWLEVGAFVRAPGGTTVIAFAARPDDLELAELADDSGGGEGR